VFGFQPAARSAPWQRSLAPAQPARRAPAPPPRRKMGVAAGAETPHPGAAAAGCGCLFFPRLRQARRPSSSFTQPAGGLCLAFQGLEAEKNACAPDEEQLAPAALSLELGRGLLQPRRELGSCTPSRCGGYGEGGGLAPAPGPLFRSSVWSDHLGGLRPPGLAASGPAALLAGCARPGLRTS
jgi:hypothetical protein